MVNHPIAIIHGDTNPPAGVVDVRWRYQGRKLTGRTITAMLSELRPLGYGVVIDLGRGTCTVERQCDERGDV